MSIIKIWKVPLIEVSLIKGSYDAISSFAFSLGCYKLLDKIPEVAKSKVSKLKRYSLYKFYHAPLKRLSQTRLRHDVEIFAKGVVSVTASVDAAVSERSCEQQHILWAAVSWT